MVRGHCPDDESVGDGGGLGGGHDDVMGDDVERLCLWIAIDLNWALVSLTKCLISDRISLKQAFVMKIGFSN